MREDSKRQMDQSLFWVNEGSPSSPGGSSRDREKTSVVLSYVQRRRRQRERIKKGRSPPWSELTESWPAAAVATPTRLPRAYPADNASDPFHATAGGAGVDARHHTILQATFAHRVKVVFLAEAFASRAAMREGAAMRHDSIVAARLRRCVHDDMVMYATLAYGAKLLGWFRGHAGAEHPPPEYFVDRALRLVRARLGRGENLQDEWLLLAVYCLTIVELWNNVPGMHTSQAAQEALLIAGRPHRPVDTARIHLQALIQLVEDRGGWHTVNPYILESVLLADKYIAFEIPSAPLIPLSAFDPGPLLVNRWPGKDASSPGYFSTLGARLAQSSIRDELKIAIQDIAGYIRVAHWAWYETRSPSVETERWLFLRLQAVTYRLLLQDELDPFESCVQRALLVFLLNATQYPGAHFSARVRMSRLRTALEVAHFRERSFDSDIRLWALCTGAMIDDSVDTDWFVGMLRSLGPLPSRTKLRGLLQSFIYVNEKQDEQLALLADKLEL